jgi:hypothetical protein
MPILNHAMTQNSDNTVPLAAVRAARGGRCPICGRPTLAEVRPFCSRRCKDIDLARWLGEAYRITDPDPAAAEEGAPSRPENDDD